MIFASVCSKRLMSSIVSGRMYYDCNQCYYQTRALITALRLGRTRWLGGVQFLIPPRENL